MEVLNMSQAAVKQVKLEQAVTEALKSLSESASRLEKVVIADERKSANSTASGPAKGQED
jgi:hypothetical protein